MKKITPYYKKQINFLALSRYSLLVRKLVNTVFVYNEKIFYSRQKKKQQVMIPTQEKIEDVCVLIISFVMFYSCLVS